MRTACVDMLKKWLADGDTTDDEEQNELCRFLKLFDIEVHDTEQQAVVLARELLQISKFDPPSEVQPQDLTPEMALLWRVYCEKLRKENKEAELDEAMPELRRFVDYIKFFTENQKLFILKQILLLLDANDMTDEVGRRILSSLLREIIGVAIPPAGEDDEDTTLGAEVKIIPIIIDHDLATIIVQQMRRATPDEADFVRQINELKAELEDLLQVDDRVKENHLAEEALIAKKKEELNAVRKAFRNERSSSAREQLEAQIEALENEIDTIEESEKRRALMNRWIAERCLVLIETLLQSSREGLMGENEVKQLRDWTAEVGLGHADANVRARAMRCVGLLYLLSPTLQRNHILPFVIAVQKDEPPVQLAALRAIFDCVVAFGIAPFQTRSDTADADTDGAIGIPTDMLNFLHSAIKFRVRDSISTETECVGLFDPMCRHFAHPLPFLFPQRG